MKPNGHKRFQVNFRVSDEDDKALTSLSRALGMTRADVIRQLIQAAIAKLSKREMTQLERSVKAAREAIFE